MSIYNIETLKLNKPTPLIQKINYKIRCRYYKSNSVRKSYNSLLSVIQVDRENERHPTNFHIGCLNIKLKIVDYVEDA